MVVIFIGPPGSGKGSQAELLKKNYNFEHFSTGELLRKISRTESELGSKIAQMMREGALITDDLVNQIVKQSLSQIKDRNCVLDGYPRTQDQAIYLDKILTTNPKVIYFEINLDTLENRIRNRFSCASCGTIYNKESRPTQKEGICDICGSQNFVTREDDNTKSLLTRIHQYTTQIDGLLNFYKQKGSLVVIDASLSKERIGKIIEQALFQA
ncbi:MAG: nucleoside monophosphate kinase [Rickettsiaceae bacterium]|nr:nucleoside monophosphate kinase [Rickettsiaceae bacterium]